MKVGFSYFGTRNSNLKPVTDASANRCCAGATRAATTDQRAGPAALVLGLGIGGTVALWSAVYGLLLRPLPFAAEERMVLEEGLVTGNL